MTDYARNGTIGELESFCIENAQKALNTHKGIPLNEKESTTVLYIKKKDNKIEYEEKNIELLSIITNKELSVYVEAYLSAYRSKNSSKNPDVVIVKDCIFGSKNIGNPDKRLVLIDCKVGLHNNTNPRINIATLKNCSVTFTGEFVLDGIVQIENCVVTGNCHLQSNSKDTPYLISKSYFIDKVNCQRHYEINLCHIKALRANPSIFIKNTSIEKAEFHQTNNIILEDIELHECEFNGIASKVALFTNITFKKTPTIHGTSFVSNNVNFKDITFHEKNTSQALGAFRTLKDLCEKAHYEHGAILFHGLELETYNNVHLRWTKFGDYPEKIASVINKNITNYGRNALTPFIALTCLFFIGMDISLLNSLGMKEAFHLSLKNSLGPFFLALPDYVESINSNRTDESIVVDIFSTFQILLSSIIWFLIIFMIRRRFKLN